MEISELQDALDEMRPEGDEPEDSVMVLTIKSGQVAEAEIKLDSAREQLSDAEIAELRRDAIGGLMVAAAEYAEEYDIDLGYAAEERIERMSKMADQHEEVQEAIESGDAAALAEALGAEQNEVPTGNEGGDDDGRGFY